MNLKSIIISIALLLGTSSVFSQTTQAQDTLNDSLKSQAVATQAAATPEKKEGFDISEIIFGHVNDAYEWHVFTLGNFKATVHFPVILFSPTKGFSVFSSSHFGEEGNLSYDGYHIVNGNSIVANDGSKVYDVSLTKSIIAMLVAVIFMLFLFIRVSNKYKGEGASRAPKGMQNAVEVCIEFIRDEVAKPSLGKNYQKYMPLLLTIFFFIWITSMLGLIPGGANLTGNIAVTGCLALISFVVMLFSSKGHFWKHLFNPPGMPIFVKIILVPIEIISLFIKPTALMIRLFANMLAGHIVLLCFVLLIFIFAEMNVYVGGGFSVVAVALSTFSMLIELLVAAIQAYIFAFLTAIFVGQMFEEPEHTIKETEFNYVTAEKELEEVA